MAFNIRMGVPEMEVFWKDLASRYQKEKLDKDEEKLFKKLLKALKYLSENPRHNSLASHEIDTLTVKYGFKVFQSYLENRTPAAGRIFWAYGPERDDLTVLAIEPHPEDQKRGAYERIKLSRLPNLPEEPVRKQSRAPKVKADPLRVSL
jgi:hypothetical protein